MTRSLRLSAALCLVGFLALAATARGATATVPRAGPPTGRGAAPVQARPVQARPVQARPVQARHGARATPARRLTLVSETAWVGPGQPYGLAVRIARRAGEKRSHLALQVTTFGRLHTRSAFDETLTGPVRGVVLSRTEPLDVTRLPSTPTGAVLLDFGVTAAGLTSQPARSPLSATTASGAPGASAAGAGTIDLHCSPGRCSGVYPVVVTLLDDSGGGSSTEVAALTTHLIYVHPAAGSRRLEVALVLPVAAQPATPGTIPVPGSLDAAQSATLATEVDSLASHPTAAEDIIVTGSTLLGLAHSSRSRDHQTLHELAALAATPGAHELVDPTFSPVDPASLVQSGLSAELDAQIARGRQVIATTLSARTATAERAGPWIATGPLDVATVDQLVAEGASELVVAPSSLSAFSTSMTPTETFTLDLSGGTGGTGTATSRSAATGRGTSGGLPVIAADPGLSADFTLAGGPALAAHTLLADLAEIYFDAPNASDARGVAAAAPPDWTSNGTFVATVLGSLAASPIVQPVTVSQLLSIVPVASQGAVRHLVTAAASTLPARAIRQARQRLASFESTIPSPTAPATTSPGVAATLMQMSDEILSAETERARSTAREARLASFNSLVAHEISLVTLTPDRTIILTSRSGQIPITVTSHAPFPIRAVLRLTSDKLKFRHGDQVQTVLLDRQTNVFDVAVRARVSGDFPLAVTLAAPAGGLVLASGQFTVRSTATSVVAVGLTALALAVLLVWWTRTAVTKRRARHLSGNLSRRAGSG